MSAAPIPFNEAERLAALSRYDILDTLPETEYDDLTTLAASICHAPISLVSLVDTDRQWFKSHLGLDVLQTSRSDSFCAHALHGEGVFEVPDVQQDERFRDNNLVTGEPGVRFYAGAPLITPSNFRLGTLCVIDRTPRQLTQQQKSALEALARQVVSHLELRRALAQTRAADAEKAHALEEKSRALDQLRQVNARLQQEIEARIKAQELLRASEARYRSVVDSVSEVIFQTDAGARWTFLNAAWQEITGWSVEESLGRSAMEFIHPGEHEAVRSYSQSLRNGLTDRRMTVRYLTRAGKVRWMEVFVRSLFDGRGTYLGTSGTLSDITERFLAERALHETTQLQRAILGSASYAIWSCDAQGVLATFNRAAEEMLLWPSSSACGNLRAPSLIEAQDLSARAEELGRELNREVSLWEALSLPALHTGRDEREWTGVRSDGTRFPMRLSLSPLRDEEGTVEGFVGIASDLTEAKRVEKLKTEFVSVVSHELRTPLTSIRGALGLVEAGVTGELPPKTAQMISIAHKNAERLVLLINDILDIEKIENGQMRFKTAPVEIGQLVQQSLQANAPYAHELNVELEAHSPSHPLWVQGDEARLLQVLANLLSNAAKFAPSGGRVRVETRLVATDKAGANQVQVDVFDGGQGVPKDFENRLFERFAQADSSATRARGGTGLGLSISRAIVEQHGGVLSYQPASDSNEHCFRFVLPAGEVFPD